MKIQCFVFSWPGQFHNALATEKKLLELGYETIVINSDFLSFWVQFDIYLRSSIFKTSCLRFELLLQCLIGFSFFIQIRGPSVVKISVASFLILRSL